MTDEQDFLAAIAADPGDVTSRLVYADWLEDRGDPRGEYLRVEHELETTSVFTPRYWDLKRRRRTLRGMTEVQPEWRETVGLGDVYEPLFTTLFDGIPVRQRSGFHDHRGDPHGHEDSFPFYQRLWRLVDRFIDAWHEPLDHESGNTAAEIAHAEQRLGAALPERLREWYQLFGRRTEDLSRGRLLDLERLSFNEVNWLQISTHLFGYDGSFGLRRERLSDPDPFLLFNIGQNTLDGPSLSTFLIQRVIEAAMHKAAVFVGCRGSRELREQGIGNLLASSCMTSELPIRYAKMIYEGRDMLCVSSARTDVVLFSARTEEAYSQLSPNARAQLKPC